MRKASALLALGFLGITSMVGAAVVGERPDPLIRKESFWRGGRAPASLLSQKLLPAPPELISHLLAENVGAGFQEVPAAAEMTPDLKADISRALSELPAQVQELLSARLFGIFFVKNLGSSAFADSVVNESGQIVGGFVALDVDRMSRSANDWATWKENTAFAADPAFRLQVRVAEDAENNRGTALRLILLHELAHVMSFGRDWMPELRDLEARPEAFAFSKLSWKSDGKRRTHRIPDRAALGKIAFYMPELAQPATAMESYRHLSRAGFVSLYASTNLHDDFAETFALYVHQILMGRPYMVRAFRGGKRFVEFRGCWDCPAIRPKRKFIESLLSVRALASPKNARN